MPISWGRGRVQPGPRGPLIGPNHAIPEKLLGESALFLFCLPLSVGTFLVELSSRSGRPLRGRPGYAPNQTLVLAGSDADDPVPAPHDENRAIGERQRRAPFSQTPGGRYRSGLRLKGTKTAKPGDPLNELARRRHRAGSQPRRRRSQSVGNAVRSAWRSDGAIRLSYRWLR